MDGIETVSIVTPNHMHSAIAKAFLEAGIHVICDKPLATSVAEAEELVTQVTASVCAFESTVLSCARAEAEGGDGAAAMG